MKTLKTVEITPVYVNFMPDLADMKEAHLYISETYGCAIHRCLCGCGGMVVTPLAGPYKWDLIKEDDKISLAPSISNYQQPCKSHYIITRSKANFV